jgi:hypothetical protein
MRGSPLGLQRRGLLVVELVSREQRKGWARMVHQLEVTHLQPPPLWLGSGVMMMAQGMTCKHS